jgi:hypothetical protein
MYLGDDAYEKNVSGARIKVRDPWRVGILMVVTLGLYSWVWFYKVNRELRDYSESKPVAGVGANPALAVTLFVLGTIIPILGLVVWVWTLRRVQRAQVAADVPQPIGLWPTLVVAVVSVIPLVGLLLWYEYVQFQLNQIWGHTPGMTPARESEAPAPAPVAA